MWESGINIKVIIGVQPDVTGESLVRGHRLLLKSYSYNLSMQLKVQPVSKVKVRVKVTCMIHM